MEESRPDTVRTTLHDSGYGALADDWLRARGLQAEGPVGHGRARLAHARDIVGLAVEALRREPTIFLHRPEEGCAECDEARLMKAPSGSSDVFQ